VKDSQQKNIDKLMPESLLKVEKESNIALES